MRHSRTPTIVTFALSAVALATIGWITGGFPSIFAILGAAVLAVAATDMTIRARHSDRQPPP